MLGMCTVWTRRNKQDFYYGSVMGWFAFFYRCWDQLIESYRIIVGLVFNWHLALPFCWICLA
eukprot:3343703-Amphidinium_carterae.1